MLMSLFTNIFLFLSLACLVIEPKFGLKLGLFVKQTNINNFLEHNL